MDAQELGNREIEKEMVGERDSLIHRFPLYVCSFNGENPEDMKSIRV